MRFAFSDEQEALRREARRLLANERGWQKIVQLGWPAIAIPEEYGGAGLGAVELGALFEEAGRALLEAPLLSTVLATSLLVERGSQAQKAEHLPAIVEGQTAALVAEGAVIDGQSAAILIVPQAGGISVLQDAPRRPLETLDLRRALADVEVARAPLPPRTGALAKILVAAESLGGAARCLDLSVDYAKTRTQFNRPIGSFQAIKHKCADLLVAVESARSAVYWAAWCAASDDGELAIAAATAQAFAAEAYLRAAGETIQIHGGIGFTWEHEAHLHFRRARANSILFGDGNAAREEVARWLGL